MTPGVSQGRKSTGWRPRGPSPTLGRPPSLSFHLVQRSKSGLLPGALQIARRAQSAWHRIAPRSVAAEVPLPHLEGLSRGGESLRPHTGLSATSHPSPGSTRQLRTRLWSEGRTADTQTPHYEPSRSPGSSGPRTTVLHRMKSDVRGQGQANVLMKRRENRPTQPPDASSTG